MTGTAALTEDASRSTTRWPAVVAWLLFVTTIVFTMIGGALLVANGQAHQMVVAVAPLGFSVVGLILAVKRGRNPLGWLMLVVGLTFLFPGDVYADYATITRHGDLPGAALAEAISYPMWVPFIGVTGLLLLLFPDGHLPSRRWRWFGWLCVVGICVDFFLIVASSATFADDGLPQLDNPFYIPALQHVEVLLLLVLLVPIVVAGGATALIMRLRRSADPIERRQLRWVAWAASVVALIYAVAFLVESLDVLPGSNEWNNWVGAASIISFVIIPIAIGTAVLKYRLYDIDSSSTRRSCSGRWRSSSAPSTWRSWCCSARASADDDQPGPVDRGTAIVALLFSPSGRAPEVADRSCTGSARRRTRSSPSSAAG